MTDEEYRALLIAFEEEIEFQRKLMRQAHTDQRKLIVASRIGGLRWAQDWMCKQIEKPPG